MYPAAIAQEAKIEAEVRAAEAALKPDVLRILYEIKPDWSDEWAIYFRAVLSDEAAAHRLHETANKVRERLDKSLNFLALGVRRYHHFRSESEQVALREKAWI